MIKLFKRKELPVDPLEQVAKARIAAEREKIEQEERLRQVLVNDPLDYNALIKIGTKSNAELLEIINKDGNIVRYYYKTKQLRQVTLEEQKAEAEGYW